ncbi:MAG TPA: Rv2175c family DNA-binding protein [Segeticoccus sp.]|uniref:Rv2175c family DNA-binding protein n=1 Tax=Segeticoccus sp. TaxID=2706531 RepID=UPI002D7F0ADC|nr:Rv2175c family DNA-binding protein [Segeticoccus sp.]HET8600289.1 Rv2175c family DNA-binding protein [Segeticoccus sp.]
MADDDLDLTRLHDLVGDWLTVPDVAERLGVPLSRVRRMLDDRDLVALRIGEHRAQRVPARFLTDEGPLPALRGTITVLSDGGMSDEQVVAWLFTTDETLPVPGAPIDALHAGHKTEIRRRAAELAL